MRRSAATGASKRRARRKRRRRGPARSTSSRPARRRRTRRRKDREGFTMRGKAIVVTGGVGAVGRVVVEGAAARGASVAVLDHAPATPEGMAERLGSDALLIGGLDLSSAEVATKVMDNVKAKFGRLDALLNIAGGFQWETVEGGAADAWKRMYALNLTT